MSKPTKPTEKEPYHKHQHSCFLLQYHLVLVTKYRHPVFTNELKESIEQFTRNYFKERTLIVMEINTDKDHIHIIFDAPPNINLATFINGFKSASSRYMRKTFSEELKKYYWKPLFWSKSYFLCTVSERSTQTVQKYIQNQSKNKKT